MLKKNNALLAHGFLLLHQEVMASRNWDKQCRIYS
nr:MAG TPA: hypothetical protein [Caudoviricetes sp.]